jgi:hypothetical protein
MLEILKEENVNLKEVRADENCFFGCTCTSLEVDEETN